MKICFLIDCIIIEFSLEMEKEETCKEHNTGCVSYERVGTVGTIVGVLVYFGGFTRFLTIGNELGGDTSSSMWIFFPLAASFSFIHACLLLWCSKDRTQRLVYCLAASHVVEIVMISLVLWSLLNSFSVYNEVDGVCSHTRIHAQCSQLVFSYYSWLLGTALILLTSLLRILDLDDCDKLATMGPSYVQMSV